MLGWMHWTWQSALGFLLLAGLLIGLAVLDHRRPSYGRKGLLPIVTTRGDRVFMSIAGFVTLTFVWLKWVPEASSVFLFLIAGLVAFFVMKWA